MIALVIVADGDRQRFIDTFSDLMQHAPIGELAPKTIVDASGDPEHRAWLDAKYGGGVRHHRRRRLPRSTGSDRAAYPGRCSARRTNDPRMMAVAQAKRTHCPQGHPYDEANTCYSGGRRFCLQCQRDRRAAQRRPSPTVPEILWSRFERVKSGCWEWTGAMHCEGYGGYGKPQRLAHRLMYELILGPIPDGLDLDHLCRNRRCVNPSHLEPVTRSENVRRGHEARRQGR